MRRLILACFIAITALALLSGSTQSHAQTADSAATPNPDAPIVTFSSGVRIRATRTFGTEAPYKFVQDGRHWYAEQMITHQKTVMPPGFSTRYYGAEIYTTPDPEFMLIAWRSGANPYSLDVLNNKIIDLGDAVLNAIDYHPYMGFEGQLIRLDWVDAHHFVMLFRDMPEWAITFGVVGDTTQPNSARVVLTDRRSTPDLLFNPPRLEQWETPFNPWESTDYPEVFDSAGNADCLQTIYNFQTKSVEVRHFRAFCYPHIVLPDGVMYFSLYTGSRISPDEEPVGAILRFDPITGTVKLIYSASFVYLEWVSQDEHTALVMKDYPPGAPDQPYPTTYNLVDLYNQKIINTFTTDVTFTGDVLSDGRFLVTRNMGQTEDGAKQIQYLLFDPYTTTLQPLFDIVNPPIGSPIREIVGSVITITIERNPYDGYDGLVDAIQYDIDPTF